MPKRPSNPNHDIDVALRQLRAQRQQEIFNSNQQREKELDVDQKEAKLKLAGQEEQETVQNRYRKVATPLAMGSGVGSLLYFGGDNNFIRQGLGASSSSLLKAKKLRQANELAEAKRLSDTTGASSDAALSMVQTGGRKLDPQSLQYYQQQGFFNTNYGPTGVKERLGNMLYGPEHAGLAHGITEGGMKSASALGYMGLPILPSASLGFGQANISRRLRTYEQQKDQLGKSGRVATHMGALGSARTTAMIAPGAAMFGMSHLPGIGGIAGAGAKAWTAGMGGITAGIGKGVLGAGAGAANAVGLKGAGAGLGSMAAGSMAPVIAGAVTLALPSIIGGIAGVKAENKRRRLRGKREPHFRIEKQFAQSGPIDAIVQRLVSSQAIQPADQLKIELLKMIESHTSPIAKITEIVDYLDKQRGKDVIQSSKEYSDKLEGWDEEAKHPDTLKQKFGRGLDRMSLGLQKFNAYNPFQQIATFLLEGKTPNQVFKELKQIQQDRDVSGERREHFKKVASKGGMAVSEVRLLATSASTLLRMGESPESKMIILQSGIFDILRGVAKRDIEKNKGLKVDYKGKDDVKDTAGILDSIPGIAGVMPLLRAAKKTTKFGYEFATKKRTIGSTLTGIKDKVGEKYEAVIGNRLKKWSIGNELYDHLQDPDKLKQKMGLIKTGQEKREIFMEKALPGKLDQITTYQGKSVELLQALNNNVIQIVDLLGGSGVQTADTIEGMIYDDLSGKYMSRSDHKELVKQRKTSYDDQVAGMTKTTEKGFFGNIKSSMFQGGLSGGGIGLGLGTLASLMTGGAALPFVLGGATLGAGKGLFSGVSNAQSGDILEMMSKVGSKKDSVISGLSSHREAKAKFSEIQNFRSQDYISDDELSRARRATFGAGEDSDEQKEYSRLLKVREAQDLTDVEFETLEKETEKYRDLYKQAFKALKEDKEASAIQLQQSRVVRTIADENLTVWQKTLKIVQSIGSDIDDWKLFREAQSRKDWKTGRLKDQEFSGDISRERRDKLAQNTAKTYANILNLDDYRDGDVDRASGDFATLPPGGSIKFTRRQKVIVDPGEVLQNPKDNNQIPRLPESKSTLTVLQSINKNIGEFVDKVKDARYGKLAKDSIGNNRNTRIELNELKDQQKAEEETKARKVITNSLPEIIKHLKTGFGTKKGGKQDPGKKGGLLSLFGGLSALLPALAAALPLLATAAAGIGTFMAFRSKLKDKFGFGDTEVLSTTASAVKGGKALVRAGVAGIESGKVGKAAVKGGKLVKDSKATAKVVAGGGKLAKIVKESAPVIKATKAIKSSAPVVKAASALKAAKQSKVVGGIAKGSKVTADALKAAKASKVGGAALKGGKVVGKGLAKGTGKLGLKAVGIGAKKIPGLGLVVGSGLAAMRLHQGDKAGAAMEFASGAISTIPLAGTALSLIIDGAILKRDFELAKHKASAKKVQEAQDDQNTKLLAKLKTSATPEVVKLVGSDFKNFGKLANQKKIVFDKELKIWKIPTPKSKILSGPSKIPSQKILDKELEPKASDKSSLPQFDKSKPIKAAGVMASKAGAAISASSKVTDKVKDIIGDKPPIASAPTSVDKTKIETEEKRKPASKVIDKLNEIISILKEGFVFDGTKSKTQALHSENETIRKQSTVPNTINPEIKAVQNQPVKKRLAASKLEEMTKKLPTSTLQPMSGVGAINAFHKGSEDGDPRTIIRGYYERLAAKAKETKDSAVKQIDKAKPIIKSKIKDIKPKIKAKVDDVEPKIKSRLDQFWHGELLNTDEIANMHKPGGAAAKIAKELKARESEYKKTPSSSISGGFKNIMKSAIPFKGVYDVAKRLFSDTGMSQKDVMSKLSSTKDSKELETFNSDLKKEISKHSSQRVQKLLGDKPSLSDFKLLIQQGIIEKSDTGVWNLAKRKASKSFERTFKQTSYGDDNGSIPTSGTFKQEPSKPGFFKNVGNIWKNTFLNSSPVRGLVKGTKKIVGAFDTEKANDNISTVGKLVRGGWNSIFGGPKKAQLDEYDSSKTDQSSTDNSKMVIPVSGAGIITSPFGPRKVKGGSSNHKGVDFRGKPGSPAMATMPGKVSFVGGKYGTVAIEHPDGTVSRYIHLSKFNVKPGDEVASGQVVGGIGGKGPKGPNQYPPHLHFDIKKSGNFVDPEIEFYKRGIKFGYAKDIVPERQLASKLSKTPIDMDKLKEESTGMIGQDKALSAKSVSKSSTIDPEIQQAFKRQVMAHEGVVLHEYKDSRGFPTIGVGHLVKRGEKFPAKISIEQAKSLFNKDFDEHLQKASSGLSVWKDVDDVRKGALLDMTFNMGVAGVRKFKNTLAALKRGDYNATAKGVLNSAYARQVGGRARVNAELLRTGDPSFIVDRDPAVHAAKGAYFTGNANDFKKSFFGSKSIPAEIHPNEAVVPLQDSKFKVALGKSVKGALDSPASGFGRITQTLVSVLDKLEKALKEDRKGEIKSSKITNEKLQNSKQVLTPRRFEETETGKKMMQENAQIRIPEYSPAPSISNAGVQRGTAQLGQSRPTNETGVAILESIFANTVTSFEGSVKQFALGQNPFRILR